MSCKCNACAVIGHALSHADSDIRTNRHAGASKRAKQGTLRHNPGSVRLETLSGPFKDLDRPSLANKHVAGEHPCHGTPDDDCLFHRFLSGTFALTSVDFNAGVRQCGCLLRVDTVEKVSAKETKISVRHSFRRPLA